MARTDNLRNVIIVVTQATTGNTWQGRGVEVQTDGTLALGTARTSTVSRDALLATLVYGSGSDYSNDDVHSIVDVPRRTLS